MGQFEYGRILPKLMTPAVVQALGDAREHRGKQALYIATKPDALDRLCEIARIQSTSASNRIENISTTDKRLRELVLQKVEPKNRDEREIVEANPAMSQRTIERLLQKMQAEGCIEKVGAARSTCYRRAVAGGRPSANGKE